MSEASFFMYSQTCYRSLQSENVINKIAFRLLKGVVTLSGNSGHVVVSKAWIGKEAIVTLKENEAKGKK
jgi:putative transposon-encoded protein